MSNVPYSSLHSPGTPSRNDLPQETDITYGSGYNIPGSPGLDQPFDPYSLPAGAAPVRFLGSAGPEIRQSYASNQTYGTAQEWGNSGTEYDSVRGLHIGQGASTPSLAAAAAGLPLLSGNNEHSYRDDPRMSTSGIPLSPMGSQQGFREFPEKREKYAAPAEKSRKKLVLGLVIVGVALGVVAAIAVPVWYFVIRPKSSGSSSSTGGGSTTTGGGGTNTDDNTHSSSPEGLTWGGDGTKIKLDNGTEFTYVNSFGGYWYFDPKDPFKSAARAQSYSPALNETWDYNVHKIMGVNLGGWLNTEPFISPALYEKYSPNAVDEFTLSQLMRADTAGGGIDQLEEHYKTFITEEDFAQIAAAGLNWIRLPFAFWAIEVWEGEPFLERVSWKYLLKAIEWSRKYGLRINLDLHAIPGSQNGWNHSGKLGTGNFLRGVMGVANAQRTLDYLRFITQFISQPQYKDVIPMFGIINEVFSPAIGQGPMTAFYIEVYDMLREITGMGAGNGPLIALHDGFVGIDPWAGTFPGSDRLALDIHPYFAFSEQKPDPLPQQALRACTTWAGGTNRSMGAFGVTSAGEFSNAINDCGLFVNGVGEGTRYEATFAGYDGARQGDCDRWTDWTKWTAEDKEGMKQFTLASMDALTHFFFWTWKIGDSISKGRVDAPFWSYKLGLENGWMPKDPRDSIGFCAGLGVPATAAPALPASATGGGTGTISAAFLASFSQWPPATLTNIPDAQYLPTYTATGTPITMPGPTFTTPGSQATFDAGSGWFNSKDTTGAYAKVAGCVYPDEYSAVSGVPIPTAPVCGGARKRDADPLPTPPPRRR